MGPYTQVLNTKIGKFCSVASNSNIGLRNHTVNNISTSPIFTEKKNGTQTSWINANVNQAVAKPIGIGNAFG